jgi:hypothetical protein
MKKRVLVTLGIFGGLLAIGAQEKSCQQQVKQTVNKEQELNQAIKNLNDPSKLLRRQAAEQIGLLIDTPGIQRAVKPLSDVLLNKAIPSGVFTQEICANDLGMIATHLGGNEAKHAIDALAESLATEEFDVVRAASANALGTTLDERAVVPLQNANANDPSPLVNFAAKRALDRLARNGIDVGQGVIQTMIGTSSYAPTDADQALLQEYLKNQIIYSNPPIFQKEGE